MRRINGWQVRPGARPREAWSRLRQSAMQMSPEEEDNERVAPVLNINPALLCCNPWLDSSAHTPTTAVWRRGNTMLLGSFCVYILIFWLRD